MRALVLLAKISAVLAGILLTFITVMTCASIVGRELFGSAITGDFELSGAATGAAIAMFMPWCQAKRGNIIVDFLPPVVLKKPIGCWTVLALCCWHVVSLS